MSTNDVVAQMRDQVEARPPTLYEQLDAMVPQVERAIGRRDLAERLVRIALTEIRKTPKLGECTPESMMGAVLTSAQLRLDPGGARGHCWFIPTWNNSRKCNEVEWWLGYKGAIELAHRSGMLAGITANVVREGDRFEAWRGTGGRLRHEVDWRATRADRGDAYAVYAHAHLLNGGDTWEVLTAEEVNERRALQRNNQKPSSPWVLWTDRMWAKTAIHALDRWLPSSADYADGVAADGRVLRWDPDQPDVPPQGDDDASELLAAMPTPDEPDEPGDTP